MHLSAVAAGAAAVVCALTTTMATTAAAQAYPQRPVRMIIANGAGSAPDVIGRLLANRWFYAAVVAGFAIAKLIDVLRRTYYNK